ncbi:MAG: hypothetical protein MZW92_29710 [Comamonadaceae bacterium]|nr:hypothetical protein [Comamonadaceae bacterium]
MRKSAGHNPDEAKLGQPSALGRDGEQFFVFVPYIAVSGNKDRTTTIEAFYLGISSGTSNAWTFVDGSRINSQNIKLFIPSYSGNPPLPQTKHTVVQRGV